jgi:hypothetical protein
MIEPRPCLTILHAGMFDRKKRPAQIGLQNSQPVMGRLLEDRNETAADPGIGINDIEGAEAVSVPSTTPLT